MIRLKSPFILFSLFLVVSSSTFAQKITVADSVFLKNNSSKNSFLKKTTVPAVLIASSLATWKVRKDVREMRNRYLPTFENHYDDYLQYVPAATVFALNAAGVKGKHSLGRATVSYGFSAIIMASLVNAVKYTAKVERPDGSTKNSYPSGHTANSFMNATFLSKEYGEYRSPLYSYGAYTLATATAVGRQLNNRHWISDVLAGAGIGIISTELGYLVTEKIFKDKGERFKSSDPTPVKFNPSFFEVKLGYSNALSSDIAAKSNEIYAKEGFKLGLEGAWFLNKYVGFGAEFSFISFPINDDKADFSDPDLQEVMDGHFTNAMGIRYFHAGPYFSLPLPKNWFITAHVNAGVSAGAKGEIKIMIKPEYQDEFGTNELPIIRYKPEQAFSWGAGVGIQKRIKRNFAVKAYLSYLNSKNDFTLDALSDIDPDGKYSYTNAGSEKVRFDNLTYGIGLTTYLW
jgi:membrane-associated phospholipid phosphatase